MIIHYGDDPQPISPSNRLPVSTGIDYDPLIQHSINVISSTYGDTVSVAEKKKNLLKFGRNPNVGNSYCTLWFTGQDQANETYVAANTNSIDTISSSNSGDTQDVVIEGHTESGGNKTFVVQTATLSGQNKVTLTTPLNRATRLYNNDSTNFAGEIYVYQNTAISSGKPSDTTKIHITVAGDESKNQSEKASTSLSSQDYWIVTRFFAGYLEKTGANAADVELEIRESGKVFRAAADLVISTGNHESFEFKPYLIIPKNADVRLRANSSTTAQEIEGGMEGFLAIVT